MPKLIFWTLLAIVAAATLVIAPNALWLSRSSAIIHNTAAAPMTLRLVYMGPPDRIVTTSELAPGASRFLWIDTTGEATLVIEVRDGSEWRRHCANYIEQGMYRVDVTIRSAADVECDSDLPLFDHLLVLDYLS